MERRTIPQTRARLHLWEFDKAAIAFRVALAMGAIGCRCKVGRNPGKPWHVEIC